jgi:Spy/CpxP family protein refolding chaperone
MKKLILTCALVACASIASFAQTNAAPQSISGSAASASPEQIAERHTKIDEQQFKLNPDQAKSVYQVELDYAKQNQAMHTEKEQPSQGRIMQARAGRDNRMKAILTPEQFTVYQKVNPPVDFSAPMTK